MPAARRLVLATATLLALATALPGSAAASVVYRFQQTSFGTLSFDATLTVPDFITADTSFAIADLAVLINQGNFHTLELQFDTLIRCGTVSSPCDTWTIRASNGSSAYAYDLGTFSTPGTHTYTIGAFRGDLTVTPSTPIPEPASLGLFGIALAGLGTLRRCWRRPAV